MQGKILFGLGLISLLAVLNASRDDTKRPLGKHRSHRSLYGLPSRGHHRGLHRRPSKQAIADYFSQLLKRRGSRRPRYHTRGGRRPAILRDLFGRRNRHFGRRNRHFVPSRPSVRRNRHSGRYGRHLRGRHAGLRYASFRRFLRYIRYLRRSHSRPSYRGYMRYLRRAHRRRLARGSNRPISKNVRISKNHQRTTNVNMQHHQHNHHSKSHHSVEKETKVKGRNNKVVVVEADQRTYGSAGSRDGSEWRERKVQQSGKSGKPADCWYHCGKQGGSCSWCGDGKQCCRKDWSGDPSSCQQTTIPCTGYHCCSRSGVTYTTTGEKCVFPFVYRGKTYRECTRIDHHSKWCSTTSNYDGKWGHCAAEGTRGYALKRSLDRKKEDVAVKSKREAGNDIRTINFDQSYSDKRQDDDFQVSQGDGSSGMIGGPDEDVSEDDINDDEGDDINDDDGGEINDDNAEIYGSGDISGAGEQINGDDVSDINGNNGGSV